MENAVTLFLLFSYTIIMGGIALKLLIFDKRKAVSRMKEIRSRTHDVERKHKFENITDSVFNAKHEISRVSKMVKIKSAFSGEAKEKPAPMTTEGISTYLNQASSLSAMVSKYTSAISDDAEQPVDENEKYEIDENTLNLLINTLSYDDFAKIYEKFVRATNEDEICKLVEELDNFREDDRLVMLLTPLLSHTSSKVQQAINDFISRTNNHVITDEIVDIIENSEYMNNNSTDHFKPFSESEFAFQSNINKTKINFSDMNVSVDKEVFNEEPHKLIMEAYATNDTNRLFDISCALSQYDDPLVLDAMLYINARLNGESKNPNLIKSNAPVKQTKRPEQDNVQKFEFLNINDIFKTQANDVVRPNKFKNKNILNKLSGSRENKSSNNVVSEQHTTDYVRGMKLVNMAKYMEFDEYFPEITNSLSHEKTFVRCCAINAAKNMASHYHNEGKLDECVKIKQVLLSHVATEKSGEVETLCNKAIMEIENFTKQMSELDHSEVLNQSYRSVDDPSAKPVIESLYYKNAVNL